LGFVAPAIVVEGVTKAYAKVNFKKRVLDLFLHRRLQPEKVVALDNVSLLVEEGEVFGLLGPNGAGKTTLIRVLTTVLTPDSGSARVGGFDVVHQSMEVRERIGVLNEDSQRGFEWRLSARTNLLFYAREYMAENPRKRVDEVLESVELGSEDASKWFQKLSQGMKQKVALARALIPDAQVVFLDEPQRGLDIVFLTKLREMIRDRFGKRERTIVLSTHDMRLIEETCDRIALINKGRIVVVKGVEELRHLFAGVRGTIYELELAGDGPQEAARLAEDLGGVNGVKEARVLDAVKVEVRMDLGGAETVNGVLRVALEGGYSVLSLTRREDSLEEVILKLLREGA